MILAHSLNFFNPTQPSRLAYRFGGPEAPAHSPSEPLPGVKDANPEQSEQLAFMPPALEESEGNPFNQRGEKTNDSLESSESVQDRLDRETKKRLDETGVKDKVVAVLKKHLVYKPGDWEIINSEILAAAGFGNNQSRIKSIQRVIKTSDDGFFGIKAARRTALYYGERELANQFVRGEARQKLDKLKSDLNMEPEIVVARENLPKDAFKGWNKYMDALLGHGVSNEELYKDRGKFGRFWLNMNPDYFNGTTYEDWVTALAMSNLSDELVAELSIGKEALRRRHKKEEVSTEGYESMTENESEAFQALVKLLGPKRINREGFLTLKADLMKRVDMKRIHNDDYLLGLLYVMMTKGEIERKVWQTILTEDERRRSVGYGQGTLLNEKEPDIS